ncbi:MAG: hydroxypyruvate reductase [Polynucleobacter sp. 24-46-87]|jgi:hydroxypyruvate reductase|uniref:glycerate kinase type-2 family protein n=1 Tax=unclassified Polynucleobacter TaxID=2640945 RepID=UPI000BCEBCC0|nr:MULTISPECIES: glycerate kinase [unclassified Polynucleobacter]OYY20548.1 MAG: hydroxypyruvate reductase [Polynucleobacter sp. 35-46-11]OZA15386.1 MAG: hydroxypyruvate reductase [Polynucleobacter sp. 24-46-87]OZA77406.1 MAG: hydroxypyruvate reductase [Polynucleobacter sp. 39-46-10]
MSKQETILKNAFAAALAVADPKKIIPEYLSKIFPPGSEPSGRCLVVGAGKASASMATALESYAKSHWPNAIFEGVVLTRYGHHSPTSDIQIIEAGHPVPDQAGMDGAKEIYRLVSELNQGDILIALISGGGSSLLTFPQAGISIDDMRKTTEALLRSGAPIEEMNVVRKHLSAILGGNLARLAIARGARVEALLISDVTGDAPADIASGPCAPDYSTYQDALNILTKHDLGPDSIPRSVLSHLQCGVAGEVPETLKEADLQNTLVNNHVIATAYKSLEAAADCVRTQGYEPVILGDTITGEARDVGIEQAALARQHLLAKTSKPIAFISGGECTVTIPNGIKGRGGRCSEYLLSLFAASTDLLNISALAADTDGIDGNERNAGAWFTPEIRQAANKQGLILSQYLEQHDCYGFFAQLDALVETGPTLTNVNDFRIILLDK